MAERSDVLLTCLPTVEAVEQVAIGPDGVLFGMRAGQALFEMSTNFPKAVARLHAAFLEKGMHFLDAPITGGAIGAQNGKLTILVGGDKASFERYSPVLRAIGDRLIHVGPSGTGIVTKLVNNCASQTTARPFDPAKPIRMPLDRSVNERRRRKVEGSVEVPDVVVEGLKKLASRAA